MSIQVTCSACQKKLAVRDEHAGKRVKCPGCGGFLAIPVAAPVQQLSLPEPPAADTADAPPPRRKKKRRRAHETTERKSMQPLFTMAGIEFTPPIFITVVLLVAILGTGVFFLARAIWPTKLDVKVVDVYVAVNGVRYTDVGERALGINDVSYTIPGNRKIVVTRKNPNGDFLLMKINVSDKILNDHLPRMAGATYLTPGHVQVRGGGETCEPLFASYADDTRGAGYQLGFSPPSSEKGSSASLEDYLGPKGEWAAWTHEGETTADDNAILFQGKNGMKVAIQTGSERIDKNRDGDPFKTLGLRKGSGKGLGDLHLGGGASTYVLVTWDNGSDGFMIDRQAERPNDISISWDIIAICPRPKNAGKELTLVMFGKEQKIKLP